MCIEEIGWIPVFVTVSNFIKLNIIQKSSFGNSYREYLASSTICSPIYALIKSLWGGTGIKSHASFVPTIEFV